MKGNERLAWDAASKMGPGDAWGLRSCVWSHPSRVGWMETPRQQAQRSQRDGLPRSGSLEDCASILLKNNFSIFATTLNFGQWTLPPHSDSDYRQPRKQELPSQIGAGSLRGGFVLEESYWLVVTPLVAPLKTGLKLLTLQSLSPSELT